jgi:hypothetical protein
MSSQSGDPTPDPSWPPPERDQVELGYEPTTLSTRARLLISAGAMLALVVATAVIVAEAGESGSDAVRPAEPAQPDAGSAASPPAHPARRPPPPPLGDVTTLPVGASTTQPYWSDGRLRFGRTSIPWRPAPHAMVSAGGVAYLVDARRRLLEVTHSGRSRQIDSDATGVLAVGGPRALLYYTRALGADDYQVVAWDRELRTPIARHVYHDRSVCCDESYAVIRGVLPDGSVILDSLDWVRIWRAGPNAFEAYPLSGASAVRALSVGGRLLLVRDEHHSVADIEMRTTRLPLLAGMRLHGANEGLLSPDGQTLAVFSGARPPYVAPTSALGVRTSLWAVGASVDVVAAMWDTPRALLLQVETAEANRGTLLVRCDAVTGTCSRVPGDRSGPHLLPDGQAAVR